MPVFPTSSVSRRIQHLASHVHAMAPGEANGLQRTITMTDARPVPGGGAGYLKVVDSRTGNEYTVKCTFS